MDIYLLQGIYTPNIPARQAEIEFCIMRNSDNALIKKYLHLQGRVSYNEAFLLTRMRASMTLKKNIYILANADIYFDDTLALVQAYAENNPETVLDKVCFALAPWDLKTDGSIEFCNQADRQDAWVFFDCVPHIPGADFFMGGQAGCDNKIAYLLEQCGYTVINPSLSVKAVHVHNSGLRTNTNVYFDRLQPPYKLVTPCSI